MIQRQGILGGERLTLDPEIEAEMRRLEFEQKLKLLLEPNAVRKAITDVDLQLEAPPPWLPKPGEKPSPEAEPLVPKGAGPATPQEAGAGDVLDAVMAVPAVNKALTGLETQATEKASRDWSRLSGAEKALVITSGTVIAGTALGGALAKPDSREFLLQQLNGKTIPVPGVEGLGVAVSTQKDNLGVMFTLDVGPLLPKSLGFR
jgi:hypothetical protein